MKTATIRDTTVADLPRMVEISNAAIPGRLTTTDTEAVTVTQRTE